jgi:hypothetical protein
MRDKKWPFVAWHKVCLLKKYVGLAIRSLSVMNRALGGKVMWG